MSSRASSTSCTGIPNPPLTPTALHACPRTLHLASPPHRPHAQVTSPARAPCRTAASSVRAHPRTAGAWPAARQARCGGLRRPAQRARVGGWRSGRLPSESDVQCARVACRDGQRARGRGKAAWGGAGQLDGWSGPSAGPAPPPPQAAASPHAADIRVIWSVCWRAAGVALRLPATRPPQSPPPRRDPVTRPAGGIASSRLAPAWLAGCGRLVQAAGEGRCVGSERKGLRKEACFTVSNLVAGSRPHLQVTHTPRLLGGARRASGRRLSCAGPAVRENPAAAVVKTLFSGLDQCRSEALNPRQATAVCCIAHPGLCAGPAPGGAGRRATLCASACACLGWPRRRQPVTAHRADPCEGAVRVARAAEAADEGTRRPPVYGPWRLVVTHGHPRQPGAPVERGPRQLDTSAAAARRR